ncbi:unnamed protein product [Urochloa humidicola]
MPHRRPRVPRLRALHGASGAPVPGHRRLRGGGGGPVALRRADHPGRAFHRAPQRGRLGGRARRGLRGGAAARRPDVPRSAAARRRGGPGRRGPVHGVLQHAPRRRARRRDVGRTGQRVLILCADYVDDYEANVPFRALSGVGCLVECACPTKRRGETCVTAIYDAAPGAAVSEERRGHDFAVTADWADVAGAAAAEFDCVVVPGGRAPELLVTHESAVALVREFADKGKVVAIIGQGHLLLAAAGLLRGRRCASGVPMRVVSRLAGAAAVENGGAVADGKLVTAAAWTDLAPFVARVVDLLGISVSF